MAAQSLVYVRLTPSDSDIPRLLAIHRLPDISRFLSIDESAYFSYVTSSPGVFYYKAYENGTLVGTVHLETDGDTADLALLVIPEHQNRGIASRILEDVKSGVLTGDYSAIRVSIDRDNCPSRHLFEKAGFVLTGEEDELLDYIYRKT